MPTSNNSQEHQTQSSEPPQGTGHVAIKGAAQDTGDDAELTDQEEFQRTLQHLRNLLDSVGFQRALDILAKRVAAEPERARLEFQLRQQANTENARFHSSNRLYFLVGLSVCLAFLAWIIWLLKGDRDTLLPVLTALIGLLAGAGGGFIFGQARRATDA